MNRFDKSTEVMHDLLLIQNDRKAVYERIVWSHYDQSIRNHIQKIILQCRHCILELRTHIDMTGSDPADRVDIRGDLYHEWPGVRDFMPGNSIPDIIVSLEHNEKKVVLAYQRALQSGNNLGEELKTLINDQLSLIHQSFNYIQDRKEKPFESATVSEEEKPFVIFRDRVFPETSVHSRLFDVSEE